MAKSWVIEEKMTLYLTLLANYLRDPDQYNFEELWEDAAEYLEFLRSMKGTSRGIKYAIDKDCIPLLEYYLEPPRGWEDTKKKLKKFGQLLVLVSNAEQISLDIALDYGALTGNLKIIKYCEKRINWDIRVSKYWDITMERAARWGCFGAVKYCEMKGGRNWTRTLINAVFSGNLDLVKYCEGKKKQRKPQSEWDEYGGWAAVLRGAVMSGNLDMVKYHEEKCRHLEFPYLWTRVSPPFASKEIVQYLGKKGIPWVWEWGATHAAQVGNLDDVKYFVSQGASRYQKIAEQAAMGGHLDIIKYCEDHTKLTWWSVARNSVLSGDLRALEYCGTKENLDWNLIMKVSASEGNFTMVLYAESQGGVNWEETLQAAAKKGFLQIVKYCFEKGAERLQLKAKMEPAILHYVMTMMDPVETTPTGRKNEILFKIVPKVGP